MPDYVPNTGKNDTPLEFDYVPPDKTVEDLRKDREEFKNALMQSTNIFDEQKKLGFMMGESMTKAAGSSEIVVGTPVAAKEMTASVKISDVLKDQGFVKEGK